MARVTVIGGGIAGLSCAFQFARRPGWTVELFEAADRLGGLLQTAYTPWGMAELAARAVIHQAEWEDLCETVGAKILPASRHSRNRYIFRGRPRKMPLGVGELVPILTGAGRRFVTDRAALRPYPGETVAAWGDRQIGPGATRYLLAPALGGIYAGDVERLSASLILGRMLDPKAKRTPTRLKARTVTPEAGFSDLIKKTEAYLRARRVAIHLGTPRRLAPEDLDHPCIVATSARQAAPVVEAVAPALADQLARTEMLSLTVVCAWYPHDAKDLKGFGCLFPADQGVRALGVIFNDVLFPRDQSYRSETWIYGGDRSPETAQMDDPALLDLVRADRARLTGTPAAPIGTAIQRWPDAVPYYTPALEKFLATLDLPPNLHLAGNYIVGIGLAKIVEHSTVIAARLGAGA